MIALAALSAFGLLALVLFQAAAYALPVVMGVWMGFAALQFGAGAAASFAIGAAAGGLTWALARQLATMPLAGKPVGALFSAVSALAGYELFAAFGDFGRSTGVWTVMVGLVGAVLVGSTTWTRLRSAA